MSNYSQEPETPLLFNQKHHYYLTSLWKFPPKQEGERNKGEIPERRI